ncbi:MFS transporter [Pullulanibacillus camelliae]|uniref:MFS transporter n=1 Tax=Pullulanibacillus camelliae TaxID=1707096 RepID=A0A8J3DVE8_9BACL|nr:MDR family MFS transporter [Pullulanibacillus camelliae]GGE44845.1 MFS transporter [Pullulanibacillus camelliae]
MDVEKTQTAVNNTIDPAIMKMAWILLIGILAPLFDTTITNVAIDTLGHALHASVSTIQWVMTSYLIALGMVIPLSGWAVDHFGDKRMWMLSLLLFLIGSVLSSLSWNVGSLILFRAIQGLGGGLMMPIMQTIIVRAAGGNKLGKLMTIVGLPALLGPILGPVFGGIIINYLDWRWIFYVNIPICIVAFILAGWGLPQNTVSKAKQSIDIIGLFLFSPAIVLIIFGLTQVEVRHGFFNGAVLNPIIVGLIFIMFFSIYALRKKQAPIMDLRLFKSLPFSLSSILLFFSGLSSYGGMLLLPLYYQQVLGKSVLASGLLLIPQGVGMLLTRTLAGKLTDKIGPRFVVLAGILLTLIGTLPFAVVGPHPNSFLLAFSLIVRGAGLGGIMLPVMATSYQGLSKSQIPDASSMTRILQQIGGAFGASVLAVILQHHMTSDSLLARADAFNDTFMWTVGFTLFSLVFALFLPHKQTKAS